MSKYTHQLDRNGKVFLESDHAGNLTVSSTTIKMDTATKLNVVSKTAEKDVDVDLEATEYEKADIIKFSWTGDNGTAVWTLPDATSDVNTNRFIRFIADGTFSSSKHVDLTPRSGQELDGATTKYRINKSFEGIAIWSDGTEWYIVQKKA